MPRSRDPSGRRVARTREPADRSARSREERNGGATGRGSSGGATGRGLSGGAQSGVRCVPLTPELWPALEQLFGANGACGGCWCMWWRVERGGKMWQATQGAKAKRSFKNLVAAKKARGMLAFAGHRPVGWCALGPRADFPRINRRPAFQRADVEGVWSINCFFIARDFRGRGVARKLLEAAIEECKAQGARIVEGYPVTTTGAGEKVPSASAYTGPLRIFEEQGFEIVQRDSPLRPLVQRDLLAVK